MFRDRFGSRHDPGNTKIKTLRIFNLGAQSTWAQLTVNQWVPGSSPGRGATFLLQINQLRSEHRRLIVYWSLEIGIDG